MTKPGRDADDLGQMIAKMMAAQIAAAAGGASAAAANGASGAPRSSAAAHPIGVHVGPTDEEAVIEGLNDDVEGPVQTVPQLERTLSRMTIESVKQK